MDGYSILRVIPDFAKVVYFPAGMPEENIAAMEKCGYSVIVNAVNPIQDKAIRRSNMIRTQYSSGIVDEVLVDRIIASDVVVIDLECVLSKDGVPDVFKVDSEMVLRIAKTAAARKKPIVLLNTNLGFGYIIEGLSENYSYRAIESGSNALMFGPKTFICDDDHPAYSTPHDGTEYAVYAVSEDHTVIAWGQTQWVIELDTGAMSVVDSDEFIDLTPFDAYDRGVIFSGCQLKHLREFYLFPVDGEARRVLMHTAISNPRPSPSAITSACSCGGIKYVLAKAGENIEPFIRSTTKGWGSPYILSRDAELLGIIPPHKKSFLSPVHEEEIAQTHKYWKLNSFNKQKKSFVDAITALRTAPWEIGNPNGDAKCCMYVDVKTDKDMICLYGNNAPAEFFVFSGVMPGDGVAMAAIGSGAKASHIYFTSPYIIKDGTLTVSFFGKDSNIILKKIKTA